MQCHILVGIQILYSFVNIKTTQVSETMQFFHIYIKSALNVLVVFTSVQITPNRQCTERRKGNRTSKTYH